MQHIKKITGKMMNIFSGATVIGSSGYESLIHLNFSPARLGGRMLGMSVSFESITPVIVPLAGGLLLISLGAWASGAVSVGLMLWVIYLAFCQVVEAESQIMPLAQEVANA